VHEITLMRNMVSILEKHVDSAEIGKVKRICLQVGELRYIVPEIMITGFKHIPKHEKLETAEIEVEIVPGNDFVIKGIEW
jgi:Zn finger protein HypA/HybF involved in hydrogenase expression